MKKRFLVAVIAVVMSSACGCSTMQAIDQWKCDQLGWCCFGVQPSHQAWACDGPAVGFPGGFFSPAESGTVVQACPTCQ